MQVKFVIREIFFHPKVSPVKIVIDDVPAVIYVISSKVRKQPSIASFYISL